MRFIFCIDIFLHLPYEVDGMHFVIILQMRKLRFSELKGLIQGHQRRQWHPTPVLLPGKSHGQRSLVSCSPWGHEELDTTEGLHFHFSLSRIGEGNGNPLQCSCLENPRDGGAWWAAVHGVTQSQTRLKRLSSSIQGHTIREGRLVTRFSKSTQPLSMSFIYWQSVLPICFILFFVLQSKHYT